MGMRAFGYHGYALPAGVPYYLTSYSLYPPEISPFPRYHYAVQLLELNRLIVSSNDYAYFYY